MTEARLKQNLGQLAGFASVCWVPEPKGVFDSAQAGQFVDQVFKEIWAEFEKLREELRKVTPANDDA